MATGHLNPGYLYPISGLERINRLPSALESKVYNTLTPEISNKRWLLTQPNMSQDVLETIRRESREKWRLSRQSDSEAMTSYLGNYQVKKLEEPTRLRPSSPTRMNNPHPSVIFLTCRLHHLPGFHQNESRPETCSSKYQQNINEIKIEEVKDGILSPVEKSNDSDEEKSVSTKISQLSLTNNKIELERPKTASTLRLERSTLRSAGQRSSFSVSSSQGSSRHQRPHTSIPKYDYYNNKNEFPHSKNLIYQKTKYPRGDYTIHYQWPMTIPHHRLF